MFANPFVEEKHELILRSPLLVNYLATVTRAFFIKHITIADVTFFGRTHVGLMALGIRYAETPRGAVTSGTVWLRGNSVAIITVLRTPLHDYAVLVRQPRLAAGSHLEETPAGMLDDGTLQGKAISEIREELGLDIEPSELITLGNGRLFTLSPGACDERIGFLACVKEVSEDFVAALEGRVTGVAEEGERIVVTVCPLNDLADTTTDAKTYMAAHLFASI